MPLWGARTLAGVSAPPAGLCESCRHRKVVRNTRGSRFSLCRRAATDPAFPKYPRLPVVECRGYEAREGDGGAAGPSGRG